MKTSKFKNEKPTLKATGLFQLGLIVALGITLVGFEYANADIKTKKVVTSKLDHLQDEVIYDDFEIEKPELPNDNVEDNTQQNTSSATTQQQTSTTVTTTTDPNQVTTTIGLPTDSVVIVDLTHNTKPITNEIFDVVEDMPTYIEFVDIFDKTKRKQETELQMLKNLYKTIKYPEMARQTGIQGKVWVQFVVGTDGKIKDIEVLKGVHPDLDNEAIRAVKTLPEMIPGKQRDKIVNVRYKMPIEFKLKN